MIINILFFLLGFATAAFAVFVISKYNKLFSRILTIEKFLTQRETKNGKPTCGFSQGEEQGD